MELKRVFFADFETCAIEPRPKYPPKPVGLALLCPQERVKRYYAWGHPSGNNSTADEARRHYLLLVRAGYIPCFHHAAFDCDVGEVHLDLPRPPEHHDTLLLAFLADPRSPSFELKPLGERYLGEAPTERDELQAWVVANVAEARRAKMRWGAYISRAPGELVGRYANGDTARTRGLFLRFAREVLSDPEQARAYERERRLTPVIVNMERRGVPVATRRLKADIPKYEAAQRKIETALMDRLKVARSKREEFKWSGEGFADQLERARVVREWIMTTPTKAHPAGQRRTGTDSLTEVGVDPGLVRELEVRAQIATCLSTLMRPWALQGEANGGLFYARFNQVRQPSFSDGRKLVGTETGRLSMTPNLQNVIRSDKDPRVPPVRDYVIPVPLGGKMTAALAKLWYLIQRDYSQQELRITAHYEDGPFLAKYLSQPDIDAHVAVMELIHELIGVLLARRVVKDLNFGLLYGMGLAKLALKLGIPSAEARRLMRAHMAALPGVKKLKEALEAAGKAGQPIYTWGGRRYFCEAPRWDEATQRRWSFEYRLLNLKIQGSAADCTKQAMLNYHELGYDARWPMRLQVHDELLTTAPARDVRRAHAALREAMAAVDFKVPMLSDGKLGNVSWHRMKKYGEAA
jgi:DNA polymerase I-like protein with 3'-5' exonuclease and polymerase domains